VMSIGAAPPVQRLAARIPDGVDLAVLAEHLQVPVDRGQSYVLAPPAQLGVNLLSAAESWQAVKRGSQCLGLPGPADPGPARRRRRVWLRRVWLNWAWVHGTGLDLTHTGTLAAPTEGSRQPEPAPGAASFGGRCRRPVSADGVSRRCHGTRVQTSQTPAWSMGLLVMYGTTAVSL
jgi:hypothetical protein